MVLSVPCRPRPVLCCHFHGGDSLGRRTEVCPSPVCSALLSSQGCGFCLWVLCGLGFCREGSCSGWDARPEVLTPQNGTRTSHPGSWEKACWPEEPRLHHSGPVKRKTSLCAHALGISVPGASAAELRAGESAHVDQWSDGLVDWRVRFSPMAVPSKMGNDRHEGL